MSLYNISKKGGATYLGRCLGHFAKRKAQSAGKLFPLSLMSFVDSRSCISCQTFDGGKHD